MAGAFLTDDLTDLFQADDFASAATFGGSTINVIFDREYLGVDVGGEVEVESNSPILYAATTDVAAAVHGSTIAIGGVTYTVIGREDDNTGVTMLRLRT